MIDGYKRRVRLPQREYPLCSRVTKMQATTNVWEKSTMTTEYDLPINGELSRAATSRGPCSSRAASAT